MKGMSLTWEEKLTITGQTQEDRRQALEKLGISVQSSGIKVEKNKCFLVNLNRDDLILRQIRRTKNKPENTFQNYYFCNFNCTFIMHYATSVNEHEMKWIF